MTAEPPVYQIPHKNLAYLFYLNFCLLGLVCLFEVGIFLHKHDRGVNNDLLQNDAGEPQESQESKHISGGSNKDSRGSRRIFTQFFHNERHKRTE